MILLFIPLPPPLTRCTVVRRHRRCLGTCNIFQLIRQDNLFVRCVLVKKELRLIGDSAVSGFKKMHSHRTTFVRVCYCTINHFFFRKKKKEPYLDLFGFHEHNSDESFISVTLFSYYKIHMILTYLIRLVQGLTNLPICNISLVFRFLPYSFSPYLFIYVDVMTWVSSLVLVLSLSSSLSQ